MNSLKNVLFALLLLPLFSAAQSNYKPGYVVNLNGDTVKGFIDFRGWDSNPTDVSFKRDINDKEKKTYTLSDITQFGVTGLATYKKYVCSISMDATNSTHLGEGRDTSSKIETVFLKVLQTGKNLALYEYRDGLKTRFYIGEAPGYNPIELVYRLYYDTGSQSGSRTVSDDIYQKQLFALANKYNALDDRLTRMFSNTSYNADDILAITSRINNISKADFESKYSSHTKIQLYVSGGLNITTTTSAASTFYSAGGGVSYTSFLPAVAVGINVIPNPVVGRINIRADVGLALSQVNAQYTLKVTPMLPAKASFNAATLSFTPKLIYNIYNAANFKFYLGAGLQLTESSYSNAYFGPQNKSANSANFPSEQYYFDKSDNAFLVTAGFLVAKNLEIYFNYVSSRLITNDGYFSFYSSSEQVGVNYFFGK